MNWSMVLDGILFWCLVLDPRPSPPARTSFGVRAVAVMIVIVPQILGGSIIVFTQHDIYSFYDLCGRIYPSIDARYDQVLGGLLVWIPPAMMSILGLILVLNGLRRAEEAAAKRVREDEDEAGPRIVLDSGRWTGL
jgi:putative membrane protein